MLKAETSRLSVHSNAKVDAATIPARRSRPPGMANEVNADAPEVRSSNGHGSTILILVP